MPSTRPRSLLHACGIVAATAAAATLLAACSDSGANANAGARPTPPPRAAPGTEMAPPAADKPDDAGNAASTGGE